MNEGDVLLADVRADPEDDFPRLVYADWLDDHGRCDRAEFIRVQVELEPLRDHGHGTARPHGGRCEVCARAAALEVRERRLFRDSGPLWWGHLPGVYRCTGDDMQIHTAEGLSYVVRRGFVAGVSCRMSSWCREGPAIVRCGEPITRVVTRDSVRAGGLPGAEHYTVFRGDGEGDMPAVIWDRHWGRGACRGRCPDGVDSYRRGTHCHLPAIDQAHRAVSETLLAWARAQPAPGRKAGGA